MDASAAIGMAQRTGLNKVRHVEVDILWIQEQVARRILPIVKIPGPQNPSDMCTKNVGVALMGQYLSQVQTEFAVGRAAVAQQLHRLAHKGLVIAAPEAGDLLIGVIGGQTSGQVIAPLCVGGQLPGVIGGLVRPECGKNNKSKSAESRGVDSWELSGVGGVWRRCLRTPRRAMFTPHRVAGGPDHKLKSMKERITRGTYLGTGKTFFIVDAYDDASAAHRLLNHGWIGTTEFREVIREAQGSRR